MVDVALAAQVKGDTAESWCVDMREKIKQKIIHKKSKNYKAPTKADAIKWANAAWDKITPEHIINGCKKCYMDPNDLDEEMAVYDNRYDEVFNEGFVPLPQHVEESDQEDSDDIGPFSYWHQLLGLLVEYQQMYMIDNYFQTNRYYNIVCRIYEATI